MGIDGAPSPPVTAAALVASGFVHLLSLHNVYTTVPVALAAWAPAMCAWSVTVLPRISGIEGPLTPPPDWTVVVVVGACTVRTSLPHALWTPLLLASPT